MALRAEPRRGGATSDRGTTMAWPTTRAAGDSCGRRGGHNPARARRHVVDVLPRRPALARRLRDRLRAALAPARAQGGARAAGWGRAALWATGLAALFVALVSPLDRLGEQFATFHMVQHLLIADLAPIALTLGLTKWILRPATKRHPPDRAGGRPVRPPGVRRRRLRRRDVAVARPRPLRRGARARPGPRRSSTSASPPRGSSTGGTCSRRSARACASPGWDRSSTWPRRRSSSASSASCSPSRPSCSTRYDWQGAKWGLTPLDDQHVAGLVMALEQSIVMGIALAYLFFRMLAESGGRGPARRALRRR